MRRSERLIERGLEFRSRQEAAGGRRQNPAWSRPPPPPRRTRTPPHGAAAAMASPSRSRSRSPRARRRPPGLAYAAPAPSPRARRQARDPRPSRAPGPCGRRPPPRPRGGAGGRREGRPGPPQEAPGPAHLGRFSGAGGRGLGRRRSAAPSGPSVGSRRPFGKGTGPAPLSLALRQGAERAEPPRPPARAPTPRGPGPRLRRWCEALWRSAAAHPLPATQPDSETEPDTNGVSCWGHWSRGKAALTPVSLHTLMSRTVAARSPRRTAPLVAGGPDGPCPPELRQLRPRQEKSWSPVLYPPAPLKRNSLRNFL